MELTDCQMAYDQCCHADISFAVVNAYCFCSMQYAGMTWGGRLMYSVLSCLKTMAGWNIWDVGKLCRLFCLHIIIVFMSDNWFIHDMWRYRLLYKCVSNDWLIELQASHGLFCFLIIRKAPLSDLLFHALLTCWKHTYPTRVKMCGQYLRLKTI